MTRRRIFFRAAAAAWLLAAFVILAAMLMRPELQADERAGLSSLVPLYFLSFPLGHLGVMALSRLRIELYTGSGVALSMQDEGLLLWCALTLLGVLQWFVLLPWVARRCRQLVDFLSRRFFTR